MERIKLPLYEILELEKEIVGFDKSFTTSEVKEHVNGFIELNIDQATKYFIHRLLLKIQEEKKLIESSKLELFQKYGESEENGNIIILPENTEIFFNELNELMNNEIEIEYKPIKIETLEKIVDKVFFNILYKLVQE
jgi:hypothetical protein